MQNTGVAIDIVDREASTLPRQAKVSPAFLALKSYGYLRSSA